MSTAASATPGTAKPTSGVSFPISPRSAVPSYARRVSGLNSPGPSNSPSSSSAAASGGLNPAASSISPSVAASSSGSNAASTILERPRDKSRNNLVSSSALSFLFAEMVSYTQNRVSGIADLEKKLSLFGYHIGQRLLPLLSHRLELPAPPSASGFSTASYNKTPKRETRLLPVLLWIHTQAWKALFGKAADSLERSTERSDEYMISTNVPTFSQGIWVPKEMNQLSVEAITAGIVEAILDGLGFPAHVSAHSVPTPEHPQKTTILIKLSREVVEREEALGPA